jgi:hypothetical protein
MTGSGKSYLAVNGLLKPLCAHDRVLIIDTKLNDPIVSVLGKPCREIPKNSWDIRPRNEKAPFRNWHRLVVHDDTTDEGRQRAKGQVQKALLHCHKEGNWVIFADELQDLGGSRAPNLGVGMMIDSIYRKGRCNGVSIVATTQAPRHIPTSFKDQSSFMWIGYISDEEQQKRLREIGGIPRAFLPEVSSLKHQEWFVASGPDQYFRRTKVE